MVNVAVLVVFQVVILIMSVVIHEVSHGLMAYRLGDPTAKYAGRLTLNPFKHLDFIGSFIVPLFMILLAGIGFGWAKPVPYNPYNLKDQKRGPALVALAGPLSNLVTATAFGLGARFLPLSLMKKSEIFSAFQSFNFQQLAELISGSFLSIFFLMFLMIVVINVILAFFNLIPIPPLDGSKLLFYIFPIRAEVRAALEQFGFVLLLVVIFFLSPILGAFLLTMLNLFFGIVVGL